MRDSHVRLTVWSEDVAAHVGGASALVTFICVLCTLRTQILRSICNSAHYINNNKITLHTQYDASAEGATGGGGGDGGGVSGGSGGALLCHCLGDVVVPFRTLFAQVRVCFV